MVTLSPEAAHEPGYMVEIRAAAALMWFRITCAHDGPMIGRR